MKTTVSLASIFPLTLFGIGAASIKYFNLAFTSSTRWALLACLALFLLSRAKFFLAFRTSLAPVLIAWIGWVFLTALWSDVPLLSFMKAIAIAATVPALVSGGMYWAQYAKPGNPLSYLAPLVALSLFAGQFGFGTFRQGTGGVLLFWGLSESVNSFGVLIAMSLPYPLYAAYRARANAENWLRTLAWLCVALVLMAFLVLTGSRASAAGAVCILLAFALAALPRKILATGALAGVVAVGAVAMLPSLSGGIADRAMQFLYKGHDQDLFYSRRNAWQVSYDHAASGGIIGVGLGVSANSNSSFDVGLSAVDYGREKGSSQLAIIEETGLIGFAIYIIFLCQLFHHLILRTTLAKPDARIAAALLTGALAGLVVQSVFEAWWTSPGSIESIFFWSTVGTAMGILRRPQAEPFHAQSGMVLAVPQ